MAGQKLFTDFPKTMGGGVTPLITSDITQKSAEDDASTLAGYKARLAAQQASEEGSYQNRLNYQRGLQLQWEKEDRQRAEDQMRELQDQRHKAFESYYRPMLEQEARTQWGMAHGAGRYDTRMGAPGYPLGKPMSMYGVPIYGRGDIAPPEIPMAQGTPVYGGNWPQYNQVQPALNAIWARSMAAEQGGFRPPAMTAFAPTAAQVYGYGGGKSKG